jgi:hypothetical protein
MIAYTPPQAADHKNPLMLWNSVAIMTRKVYHYFLILVNSVSYIFTQPSSERFILILAIHLCFGFSMGLFPIVFSHGAVLNPAQGKLYLFFIKTLYHIFAFSNMLF